MTRVMGDIWISKRTHCNLLPGLLTRSPQSTASSGRGVRWAIIRTNFLDTHTESHATARVSPSTAKLHPQELPMVRLSRAGSNLSLQHPARMTRTAAATKDDLLMSND